MRVRSLLPARRSSDARAIAASLAQPERFGVIFDRHFDAIHAYVARRVDRAAADDLASTTFVVAFERRASFRPEATSARPWLYGIATNLLRDQWRAQERGTQVHDALRSAALAGPAAAFGPVTPGLGELEPRLANALAALDPDQRDVLLMVAWDELSYAEIAELLDVPVGTVRSRLSRARGRLTEQLTRAMPETEPQESHR